MRTIGNILWLIFGGLSSAIAYCIGGIALCFTVIGIPFGLQCFKIAGFVIWPFGRMAVNKPESSGGVRVLLNILWLLIAGLWLALGHIFLGIILCITIIGIPFGKQHFKLVEISLMPFGKMIIDK